MSQQGVDLQQQQFSALIDGSYDCSHPKRGHVCYATVLSVCENNVIVDLGSKRDGIIQHRDLELLDDAYRASLQVGDRVPVYILAVSNQDELIVSLNLGLTRQDWLRASEFLENGEIQEAKVTDVNRGGVIVSFGHLRGFVPNSQLATVHPGMRESRLLEAKSDMVGQTLSLAVIEVDQQQRRLVFSQRAAGWRKSQQLLEELVEGEIRTGVVSNLVEFGAFVDLGGLDGLIHVSELDWKRVTRPDEVLSVGDEIEVYVLKVDRKQRRVGLSRKRLLPDPWQLAVQELHIGQCVEGTVTGVVKFGVFVNLGEGVEGLVHTSQIADGQDAPADLEPGSLITVRVLEIDRRQRRIALSLRDVPDVAALPMNAEPTMLELKEDM